MHNEIQNGINFGIFICFYEFQRLYDVLFELILNNWHWCQHKYLLFAFVVVELVAAEEGEPAGMCFFWYFL